MSLKLLLDAPNRARIASLIKVASALAWQGVVNQSDKRIANPIGQATTSIEIRACKGAASIGSFQVVVSIVCNEHPQDGRLNPSRFPSVIDEIARANPTAQATELTGDGRAAVATCNFRLSNDQWLFGASVSLKFFSHVLGASETLSAAVQSDYPQDRLRLPYVDEFFGLQASSVLQTTMRADVTKAFATADGKYVCPADRLKLAQLRWQRQQHTGFVELSFSTLIEPIEISGPASDACLTGVVRQALVSKGSVAEIAEHLLVGVKENIVHAVPALFAATAANTTDSSESLPASYADCVVDQAHDTDGASRKPHAFAHVSATVEPSLTIDDRPRLYLLAKEQPMYVSQLERASLPLGDLLSRIDIGKYFIVSRLDRSGANKDGELGGKLLRLLPPMTAIHSSFEWPPASHTLVLGPRDLIVDLKTVELEQAMKLHQLSLDDALTCHKVSVMLSMTNPLAEKLS